MLVSTHVLAEARQLADDMLIIARGRLVAHGTPEELLRASGGFRSVRVRTPECAVGALNIYAAEGGSFRPTDRRTAALIAEEAAILVERALALLSSARLNDQLRQAVATREIIGEAKGILMQSQICTRDQAFDILRRASQRENRKLRELAEELVMRVEARAGRNVPGR